jgi:energy-coupling factor transporter ATP-binding protein EcfA2
MEIVLKELSLNSLKEDENLKDVNYVFKEGITFCYGLKGIVIKELLFQERKMTSGIIMVNKIGLKKDIAYIGINDFKEDNLLKELNYYNVYYHLNYHDIEKRGYDALKMVGLSSNYLTKSFSSLSSNTLKKLILARSLFINPQIMIFDNYEKGLTGKDQIYFNKLINKLVKMYHKNIIICSNDFTSYIGIINNIVVFKDGKIVYKNDNSFYYDEKVYQFLPIPDIISFINYVKKQGHNIDNYLDIKEIIKSIYRDVENK